MGERVCLVERCERLSGKGVCRVHAIFGGKRQVDPFEVDGGDRGEWQDLVGPRMEKLERIGADAALSSFVAGQARRELEVLRFQMAIRLVPECVRGWQAESGGAAWRLPPDGWIARHVEREFPDLHLSEVHRVPDSELFRLCIRVPEALDWYARAYFAHAYPVKPPFLPITERRSLDEKSLVKLEKQEAVNLGVLDGVSDALIAYKHDNRRRSAEELFDVPDVDSEIPSGTIVFHQMVNPVGEPNSMRITLSHLAFRRHAALEVGHVVSYDHVRASTLNPSWLHNLGHTWASPVGLNGGEPETALRLELAPLRGIYVGKALSKQIRSHLANEMEVVLPAGTLWRVVGVVDAEHHVDWEHGERRYGRLRTIQMKEIAESAECRAMSIPMTATPAEATARCCDLEGGDSCS